MASADKNSFSLPSRNKFSSRGEWEKASWKKILSSGKTLDSLVSPYERHNIFIRAAIMELVDSGKGVRGIARELQISTQTVGAIKKAMKESGYKSYRERGKTERKKKEYSSDTRKKKEPYRRYRRTKYGKVYLSY